jgi:hypothetical protein
MASSWLAQGELLEDIAGVSCALGKKVSLLADAMEKGGAELLLGRDSRGRNVLAALQGAEWEKGNRLE